MAKQLKMKGLKWPFSTGCLDAQTAFNGVAVTFILMSSVGLWTCLLEIDRLKQSTEHVVRTVSRMSNVVESSNTRPLQQELQDGEKKSRLTRSVYGKRDERTEKVYKRDAYHLSHSSYDPISQSQDMEFCLNLVIKKCGGSLPGVSVQGPPGRPGPPGAPGGTGPPGRPGAMGHMGPPGINGLKGHKGDTGEDGRVGEPGSDGPRGTPGLPGVNGIPGPEGRRGKRGIPGPPGIPGLRGPPGLPGHKGDKGETGYAPAMSPMEIRGPNCTCFGEKGEKGQRGLVGFTGYKGEKGEPGNPGIPGTDIHGLRGPIGPPGLKGEKGDPGYCHYSNCANYIGPNGSKQEHYTVQKDIITKPIPTTTTATTTSTTVPTTPPTISPRTEVCTLTRVAIPDLYDNKQEGEYGAVLRDMHQPSKIWLTHGHYGQNLVEYKSVADFEKDTFDKVYNLQFNRFHGTQHAIYNNSFFYQLTGKSAIVRYDLVSRNVVTMVEVPFAHANDSNYLYKEGRTYFDVTANDEGLWVLYGRPRGNSSMLHVMKLDLVTLLVERIWTLPVETRRYGNSFIACGVLYLINDTDKNYEKISYTYDLYTDVANEVDIGISIPFKKNPMISFNVDTRDFKQSALWAWDGGYVLKYTLLF